MASLRGTWRADSRMATDFVSHCQSDQGGGKPGPYPVRLGSCLVQGRGRAYPRPGLESRLQPGFLLVVLHGDIDIVDGARGVPSAAKPETQAAPDVACMITCIAGRRGQLVEIVGPAFVAVAHPAVGEFRVEGGILLAHGPFRLEVGIFDLENAIALVATAAIPCSRRAKTLVRGVISQLALMPV